MKNFFVCAIFCGFIFSGPETELISEINRERETRGVMPLAVNWEAARLARYKSEEMVSLNFFGHESRVYGEPDEMLARFGVPFTAAAVNIAKGQETAREVLAAWLASPAHREILLDARFTAAGAGVAFDDGIPYWTLFLISSENEETSGIDDAVLPVFRICESNDASVSLCSARFRFSSGSGTLDFAKISA